LPAAIWIFVILVLSTRDNVALPPGLASTFGIDKIGHAGAYFVWCMLVFAALNRFALLNRINALTVVLLAILLGTMMEFVQYWFFPTRFFEVLDIISNIIGALSSLLAKRFLTP
jgi:VanZ family protein